MSLELLGRTSQRRPAVAAKKEKCVPSEFDAVEHFEIDQVREMGSSVKPDNDEVKSIRERTSNSAH